MEKVAMFSLGKTIYDVTDKIFTLGKKVKDVSSDIIKEFKSQKKDEWMQVLMLILSIILAILTLL